MFRLLLILLLMSCSTNLDKQYSYKDKEATKKYKTKLETVKAYYQYLENQNKYNEEKIPDKLFFMPDSVVIDSQKIEIKYGKVKDSVYAFGILDTCTKKIAPLKKDFFIIDTTELRKAGFGHWDNKGILIYYKPTKIRIFFWIAEIILGIGIIIFFIRKIGK